MKITEYTKKRWIHAGRELAAREVVCEAAKKWYDDPTPERGYDLTLAVGKLLEVEARRPEGEWVK